MRNIDLIHDLLISFNRGGKLFGQLFAYNEFLSKFPLLKKKKTVIGLLIKVRVGIVETLDILEQQMAALQDEDKEAHLFLNRVYQNHAKELQDTIKEIDKML
jgi:hypothetical protein